MYDPPAGHRQLWDAFAECPAPRLGLPQYCLGHISESMLSNIEDHLEEATASEASELQMMLSGGLLMPSRSTVPVSNLVERRYFGPHGGGRGLPKHGWAGSLENFVHGVYVSCLHRGWRASWRCGV